MALNRENFTIQKVSVIIVVASKFAKNVKLVKLPLLIFTKFDIRDICGRYRVRLHVSAVDSDGQLLLRPEASAGDLPGSVWLWGRHVRSCPVLQLPRHRIRLESESIWLPVFFACCVKLMSNKIMRYM